MGERENKPMSVKEIVEAIIGIRGLKFDSYDEETQYYRRMRATVYADLRGYPSLFRGKKQYLLTARGLRFYEHLSLYFDPVTDRYVIDHV